MLFIFSSSSLFVLPRWIMVASAVFEWPSFLPLFMIYASLDLCWAFMGIKNVYSRVLGGFTLGFTARASAPQFSPCLPLRHWEEQLSDTSAHGCWTMFHCLVFKQFYKHFSDLMHPQIQSLLSASVSALRAGWISVQGITTGFNIMPFPSEELLEDTSLRKTSKQSGEVRILLSLASAWL